MINVGIIGAGKVCLRHINAIACNDCAKVVAVADIVRERATEAATLCGATPYTDYAQMTQSEKLDAVVINLPHKLHVDCAVFCAQRGINVLVEKPMAVTTADCDAMIEAAAKSGVKLMIGHIQRYFQENILARKIILSGELGKLAMIVDMRNTDYFSHDRPKWFFDKPVSGGGLLMNFGAHSLDKIKWLTGSNISSITGNVVFDKVYKDIEGSAQVAVKFDSGMIASLNYCGNVVNPVNETILYFTNGVVKLRTGSGVSVIRESGAVEDFFADRDYDPFKAQMNEFIDCIKNNLASPISGEYGREIVTAIEAVYAQKEGIVNA